MAGSYSTGGGAGRYGAATSRVQMGFGLVLTVQTRGWVFNRQEVERRVGSLTNGQFRSTMKKYGQLRSRELQAQVSKALAETRVPSRKKVSTDNLDWVLSHQNNRVVRPFAYGVGVPSWLNRSRAKYWRQIDQGYAGHVGRPMIGAWGEGAMRSSAGRQYPGTPYTRAGENERGSFVPYSVLSRSRTRVGRDLLGEPASAVGGRMVIRRPIVAQHYFRVAWQSSNMRQKAIRDLRQAVREALR